MNAPEQILAALDRHMTGPGHIRLMGGAALILGYGLSRSTEDADLLLDDDEVEALIERADLGPAIEATNREMEPFGLYLTHIWGPEQQILTPEWRDSCRGISLRFEPRCLSVSVLGPVDLVLSKLCRADDGDLADIAYLLRQEAISHATLEQALARAVVPREFAEIFPKNADKARALAL